MVTLSAGVPEEDIELFEINDFYTHDEIKRYKGRIAETSYTPYLAFNGKVRYLKFDNFI